MTHRSPSSRLAAGILFPFVALSLLACSSSRNVDEPVPYRQVYVQDFSGRRSLESFEFSDPEAWGWSNEGDRPSMEILRESRYQPPHPSPTGIALVPGLLFGDFDLEVELLQTGPESDHREMCLIFGFQSPKRFYYVHLGTTSDEHAQDVYLVDDAERVRLLEMPSEGIDWDRDTWHRVRIERRLDGGTIRVFWDGDDEPILTATDHTFGWGQIGFGSFEGTGRIADVRIFAPGVRVYSGPDRIFR